MDLAEATSLLARTPLALRGLYTGLDAAWLETREAPGTFSPRDVLAHLIHSERVNWIPRARHILEKGAAEPFTPFARDGFLEEAQALPIASLLDLFEHLRTENLAHLEALRLGPDELAKTGTHPAFGEVTLAQLLATWVVHDLDHLGQIARVMAKRYTADVGPWSAYLPILAPRP